MNNNLKYMGCIDEYNKCDIVLFGAPFDGTVTNRPGTRFAPNQIRIESYGLEEYSPLLDSSLEDINIFDAGDIELTFGDTKKALNQIKEKSKSILNDGKKPFMIGGEHLVTLPQFEAIYEKYPEVEIIQFDAHTDLRKEYMGVELSHSTVMYHISKIIKANKIHQFCIRSGTKEEFEYAKKNTNLELKKYTKLKKTVEKLGEKPVYITLDLDVLDPSIFPGTGTPEPGGISFNEMEEIISIIKDLNIVGMDVVELSPDYDNSNVSTIVSAKIIRELLLAAK